MMTGEVIMLAVAVVVVAAVMVTWCNYRMYRRLMCGYDDLNRRLDKIIEADRLEAKEKQRTMVSPVVLLHSAKGPQNRVL